VAARGRRRIHNLAELEDERLRPSFQHSAGASKSAVWAPRSSARVPTSKPFTGAVSAFEAADLRQAQADAGRLCGRPLRHDGCFETHDQAERCAAAGSAGLDQPLRRNGADWPSSSSRDQLRAGCRPPTPSPKTRVKQQGSGSSMASGTSAAAGSGHRSPSRAVAVPSMSGRSRTSRPVCGTSAITTPRRAKRFKVCGTW
jgi:hypothetical protein